ncbi:MAG: hypothetical protein WB438_13725 [Candidatus Cybelea sp.]
MAVKRTKKVEPAKKAKTAKLLAELNSRPTDSEDPNPKVKAAKSEPVSGELTAKEKKKSLWRAKK